jgi:hypothetical protein
MKYEKLKKIGEWLNTQGYGIDLEDDFWMEEYDWFEHKTRDICELLDDYHTEQLSLGTVSQRSEQLPLEDAKFIYNLLPKWVKEEPADGLSPTFYGTLTKEGDLKVQEQVKRILGNCG